MRKKQPSIEINFDTLVGPTHHFGGLSYGNIASSKHKAALSRPKMAALEGLEKMHFVSSLGIVQGVLPPQPRPAYPVLRSLGFSGTDQDVIKDAFKKDPFLLLQCSSSSSMWAANSATVTASADSKDKKVHITPANLVTNLHRAIEAKTTEQIFRYIFKDEHYFSVHSPLFSCQDLSDEGAANQTRFSHHTTNKGLYLFVYGRSQETKVKRTQKYPARQTLESLRSLVRIHGLSENQVVLAMQNPDAIDAGVFHNDVIATGHETLFLLHKDSYINQKEVLLDLQKKAKRLFGQPLDLMEISRKELSIEDGVKSYFFNSQILTAKKTKIFLAPHECETTPSAKKLIQKLHTSKVIGDFAFISLSESMKNGGGPACVRLRLPLTEEEVCSLHQGVLLTKPLYEDLKEIICTYYPDELYLEMFLDREFRKNSALAYSKIIKRLGLPAHDETVL